MQGQMDEREIHKIEVEIVATMVNTCIKRTMDTNHRSREHKEQPAYLNCISKYNKAIEAISNKMTTAPNNF